MVSRLFNFLADIMLTTPILLLDSKSSLVLIPNPILISWSWRFAQGKIQIFTKYPYSGCTKNQRLTLVWVSWKIVQYEKNIFSYSAPDGQPKESNMAVMEVNLPSGFTVDQDGLADIEGTESVKVIIKLLSWCSIHILLNNSSPYRK